MAEHPRPPHTEISRKNAAAGRRATDADDAIDRVQRELTTIARRGTMRARRGSDEPLTAAERTLLGYIHARPGCRLIDIAAHFGLNKSTLTRQARRLVELDLVSAAPNPDGRGHALTLTREGERRERLVARDLRDGLTERLRTWSDDDIDAFAAVLERFNRSDPRPDEHAEPPLIDAPGVHTGDAP